MWCAAQVPWRPLILNAAMRCHVSPVSTSMGMPIFKACVPARRVRRPNAAERHGPGARNVVIACRCVLAIMAVAQAGHTCRGAGARCLGRQAVGARVPGGRGRGWEELGWGSGERRVAKRTPKRPRPTAAMPAAAAVADTLPYTTPQTTSAAMGKTYWNTATVARSK